MASNIRKCDICDDVFEISHAGSQKYNQIELPSLQSLERIVERALKSDTREYVWTRDCDICTSCLLAICKAMLTRRELKE